MILNGKYKYEVICMTTKQRNSKKKMASLGLKKDINGDYTYIDPNDTTSEFVPVRKGNQESK